MNKTIKQILFSLLLFLGSVTYGQIGDHELANFYYNNGEFDKAVEYYQQLYKKTENTSYLDRYIDCLIRTDNTKEAEKTLKKFLKKEPFYYQFAVQLGEVLEAAKQTAEADKHYQQLINDLPSSSSSVVELSNAFKNKNKYELALQTLLKGRKLLKDKYPFNAQLAEVYGTLGKSEEMIDEYIGLIEYSVAYKNTVQNIMTRYLSFEEGESKEYQLMREKLIERTQKHPNEPVYAEMLIWLFMHRGNYSSALIHAKALDKRTNGMGRSVLDLGIISKNAEDYTTARTAFQYVKGLGKDKPYYIQAEAELLNSLFIEVTQNRNFSQTEIQETELAYNEAIDRIGLSAKSFQLLLELSEIQAFYGNKPEAGKQTAQQLLKLPGASKLQYARAKILLADIEVLMNNIWDASLLYMQVDNDFKHDVIGAEAKFKNARIYYFDAEFVFAQSQLDVLKASTSKLIANDALKLSLLITDNLGLDSNYTAMRQFATADLLIEQHQYTKAFQLYDSILTYYPFHGLADEVLLRKSKAMQMQGKWSDAIPFLEKIYSIHGSDILADDAVMQLAQIYDKKLHDLEKAKEWYKKILFEYKGSLHVVEARKRYRELTETNILE
jgi:tetratricopeptide (TPR) repeat protein